MDLWFLFVLSESRSNLKANLVLKPLEKTLSKGAIFLGSSRHCLDRKRYDILGGTNMRAISHKISLVLLCSGLAHASFAEEQYSDEVGVERSIASAEALTVSEVLQHPDFDALPKTNPMIQVIIEIEALKAGNPEMSDRQLVMIIGQRLKHMNRARGHARNSVSSVYDQWQNLTTAEQILVATHPANAALTYMTKDLAYELTQTHQGRNGLGDPSDAFRHAIWNAIMSRYISKSWAEDFATAHEDKTEDELNQTAADGYSEREHKAMDLHNNEQGRDCWSVWTDTIITTSDEDLVERVKEKLSQDKLIWLHP